MKRNKKQKFRRKERCMDRKLKMLFDYQRFEKNQRLEELIRETESRYAKDLSDEELGYVNAAGEVEMDMVSHVCAETNDKKTTDF